MRGQPKFGDQAIYIPMAIAIGIVEGANVHLVENGIQIPWIFRHY